MTMEKGLEVCNKEMVPKLLLLLEDFELQPRSEEPLKPTPCRSGISGVKILIHKGICCQGGGPGGRGSLGQAAE